MEVERLDRSRFLRCVFAVALLGPGAGALAQDHGQGDLEEVVVTSSRIEMPLSRIGTSISVIDGAEIELRGYSSLTDVLRTQPGIAVSGSGGVGKVTTLRVRGEEGFRTLVVVDGIKLADPTAPQVGPSVDHLLTTGDLERVEVLRGTQGFIYGADAGGVINVMSRTGQGPVGGRLGIEYGAYDTRALEGRVSGGSEKADYSFSIKDLQSEGFNAQTADTILRDDDGYENTTVHAKLGWNATENLRLQLVAHDIDARSQFDGCGFPTSFDCVGTSQQTTYRISADLDAGNFANSFALSNLDVATASFADGIESFASDGALARAEYMGSYKPTALTTFVYGLESQREAIESEPETSTRRQDGYYFEYQGQLTERFFMSAGARYDVNEDFGSHRSGRVTIAYLRALGQGGSVKYRASIGSGFRAPSLFEIAYARGGFAFPPASELRLSEETSTGYDLGVDFGTADGASFALTYFKQRIENEIYFDLTAFSGYLQASGQSESRGLEAIAVAPIGARWQLLANFTYNDTSDIEGRQRIRRPQLFGNVGFRYASTSERVRLIANYRLARDTVDEVFGLGRLRLDDYGVFDVGATVTVSPLLELYARVENLTDEQYEEIAGFRTPGRIVVGGGRLNF